MSELEEAYRWVNWKKGRDYQFNFMYIKAGMFIKCVKPLHDMQSSLITLFAHIC